MSKLDSDLESLVSDFGKASIPKEDGVSFAGEKLQLNTEENALVVVDKINACPDMEFLNMEGNTLGVKAAEVIAQALETKSKMKKALWKDMFTGRMKDEIPEALKHLSKGLMKANAKLEILDLSDNALGPIGAVGIIDLLKSPTCYSLQELKLNNEGLGITGAKMIAEALKECLKNSKAAGTPLSLKVFIAGRNRLENEGITALASVFEELETLEEVQVPQNGIYYKGIRALSKAFAKNKNLKIINLNDNTLNPQGSLALSESLSLLHNLVRLDLGDCLVKTAGAVHIADALKEGHLNLEEVVLSSNSIRALGALSLINGLSNKPKLKKVILDGNQFGEGGIEEIRKAAKSIGIEQLLDSMSEDEGDESDDDEEEDYERALSECEEEEDEEGDYSDGDSQVEDDIYQKDLYESDSSTASDGFISDAEENMIEAAENFLDNPTKKKFAKLGTTAAEKLTCDIARKPYESQLNELMSAIMKVSSLINVQVKNLEDDENNIQIICTCEELYSTLFDWAKSRNSLSYVNNTLPVLLGLIKDEETKKPVTSSKQSGCLFVANYLLNEDFFIRETKEILTCLIQNKLPA